MMTMQSTRILLSALALVIVGGCASEPSSQSQANRAFERPGWADQSYAKNPSTGEHYFTGLGYGENEANARDDAQSDAVFQFAHHLGAEVITGKRIRARASAPESSDIMREERVQTDYTGIASDALLKGARLEFTYNPNSRQAWARLIVRDRNMEQVSRRLQADYERQARQRAAIEQQLIEQRLDLAEGNEQSVLFGRATGTVVMPLVPGQSILGQEQEAIERARYRAVIELNSMLNGESVRSRTEAGEKGDLVPIASSVSAGRVFWEPVAERVWALGNEMKAQVTLFGWSEVQHSYKRQR